MPTDSICLNVNGQSKPVYECHEHRQSHTIDILLRREPLNNQRCQYILSILIHELCHALLDTYCCRWHIFMADLLCTCGLVGQNKAWAGLFLWVRASARIAFGLDIDLELALQL